MKTVALESTGSALRALLPRRDREEAVFLTVEGQVRFVVLPADEGDREVLAMRANRQLMQFLDHCGQRARQGPRKTLEQLRAEDKPLSRRAGSKPGRRKGQTVKRRN